MYNMSCKNVFGGNMDKSSNIKQKSTKIMLIVYRLFLKLAFAFLILAGFVIYKEQTLDFTSSLLVFSLSSSLIFAVSYVLTYYLYKYYNKNKFEIVKKDPLKMQILLMCRLISFVLGAGLFVYGVSLALNSFLGVVLILIGLVLCEMLFANKRITSHLSTFFENVSAGLLFACIYFSAVVGIGYFVLIFWIFSLVCLLLQEFFYHFTNVGKHNKEDVDVKQMIKIRLMYFIRNALVYTLLYVFTFVASISNLYSLITSSGVALVFFQLLPLIISIITVVILFYTTFSKKEEAKEVNYNLINDKHSFGEKLKRLGSKNIDASFDYVTSQMSAKNGYVRKSGEDYFYHCLNTANILMLHGINDEEVLSTALLHDCIEDMPNCKESTIQELTNNKIAHSVVLLSKKKDINYKEDKNMNEYLNAILQDRCATLVKIADRMHNISTLGANFTENAKIRKREETKKYFIPFVENAISLYPDDAIFLRESLNFFKGI